MAFNSDKKTVAVPQEEVARQKEYIQLVRSIVEQKFANAPKAFVHTYGCQGNVSDGERLKGMLEQMGYVMTEELDGADLVLITPAQSVSTRRTECSATSVHSSR